MAGYQIDSPLNQGSDSVSTNVNIGNDIIDYMRPSKVAKYAPMIVGATLVAVFLYNKMVK